MEKAELRLRQVWCTETSASEPLMTYRKLALDDVETGGVSDSRDESGDYLRLGQATSGIEAA
jgi:hypothetical protein